MHDVIIIGGAFAGLAAASQLGRARRKVLVLDSGAPRNRFALHSHGFLTRDGAPPLELLAEARSQLAIYPTVEIRTARAVSATRQDADFEIELDSGDRLSTRRIILAHGMTDDLSVLPPGAVECWGKTMFFCPYCHGFEFADRPLGLLLRHGDPVELARFYMEWTSNFTLFTNGDTIEEAARETLAGMDVKIIEDVISRFEHEGGELDSVVTAQRTVPLAALFTHPPVHFTTDIGVTLGCQTSPGPLGPFFTVDAMQATTVPGVFAAGDAARPAASITFAAADGVMAGVAAHRSLFAT